MGGPPKRYLHLTRKSREKLNWRIMSNTRGGDAHMGRIVALMDDLFFQMKVAETAKHLGLELKVATNGDALLGTAGTRAKPGHRGFERAKPAACRYRAAARSPKRSAGHWISLSRSTRSRRPGASGRLQRSDAALGLYAKPGRHSERCKGLTVKSRKDSAEHAHPCCDCAVSVCSRIVVSAQESSSSPAVQATRAQRALRRASRCLNGSLLAEPERL